MLSLTELENDLFYLQLQIKSREKRLKESREQEAKLINKIKSYKDNLNKN